jgi:hypothetical protein
MSTKTTSIQPLPLFSAALLLSADSAFAQSATCSALPTHQATPAEVALPLVPAYENVNQISGYKLAVDFPKGKAKLTVDTAASGLYIGRALAETNNFQHAEGAGWLDSGHLKVGQSISVKVLRDWIAP